MNMIKEQRKGYTQMLHSKLSDNMPILGTNKKTMVSRAKTWAADAKGELKEYEDLTINTKSDFTLTVKKPGDLTLGIAVDKMICFVMIKYTAAKTTEMEFPLSDFVGHCMGKEAAKSTQYEIARRAREVLEGLCMVRFGFTEKKDGKEKVRNGEFLLSGCEIKNGMVRLHINEFYDKSFTGTVRTLFPEVLFEINEKKPNAYRLGRKMALNYSMQSNHKKKKADILSVGTLLKYTDLPTMAEAKKKGWVDRLKKPLEKSLDELIKVGYLNSWHYAGKKRSTDILTNDPDTFEKLNIIFDVKDKITYETKTEPKAEPKPKKKS